LHKQKQNGHQRKSNVDKSLASREWLQFKEVIS